MSDPIPSPVQAPRNGMDDLIAACQPGKHFLGLWITRQRHHRTRKVLWTVTYWALDNEYEETRCYADPMRALKACANALKVTYD